MNTIEITANNHVVIGNRPVASVAQTAEGTRVYRLDDGKTIDLPSNVYSLATDRPASGVPGRADFERDLTRALDQLAPVRAAATDLSRELQYAHLIIRHALAVMTAEQKVAWAELNAAAQCDGEGITRANEREQSLRRAMRALVS